MSDPLADYESDLLPENLSQRVVTLDLPIRSGGDDRYLAYLGLYDCLAERASEKLGEDAEARLLALRLRIGSLEGPLRFALWEGTVETEHLRRAARITSGESRLKREWLIPRLQEEIALYRRRVDALESVLERT